MNRKMISSGLIFTMITFSVWFLTRKDPEGFSRRPPSSMHAHQDKWPTSCRSKANARQPPIALSTGQFARTGSSAFTLKTAIANADLLDVGHTFQVRYSPELPGARIEFEGAPFELRQFHFHKPSEHVIDGKQFEMEAHFVFFPTKSAQGRKAVVLGFPINVGNYHSEISKIWKHLPPYREGYGEVEDQKSSWNSALDSNELEVNVMAHHEKRLASNIPVDLSRMFPSNPIFLVYEGSLTTPSCEEGITHVVSLIPMEMGYEQIEHFEGYYEGSNRDLQPVESSAERAFRRATLTRAGG